MARHRARTRGTRRLFSVLALLGLVAAVVFSPQAANALGGKTARTSNPDIVARCTMQVQSVNTSNGTEALKVTVQVQPARFSGYFNNVYVIAYCDVLSPNGDLLGEFFQDRDGAVIPPTSTTMVVPIMDSYQLCVTAAAVLKNGNVTNPPSVCV